MNWTIFDGIIIISIIFLIYFIYSFDEKEKASNWNDRNWSFVKTWDKLDSRRQVAVSNVIPNEKCWVKYVITKQTRRMNYVTFQWMIRKRKEKMMMKKYDLDGKRKEIKWWISWRSIQVLLFIQW